MDKRMKKIRMFAVAAIAAVSMSATAQVTYGNDHSYKPTSSHIYGADNENFGLFYIQYSPSKLRSKTSFGGTSASDSESVNVLSLGYTYHISLGENLPLYLCPGGAVQWFFKSKKEKIVDYYAYSSSLLPSEFLNSEYTSKLNMISIKIPVTLMYSFELGEALRIEPYAGVYGRVNLWAERKATYDSGALWKVNPFDKKEIGEQDVWKRIQAGWTAGVNFRITNAFTIGAGYYMDLLKLSSYEADYKNQVGNMGGTYKASSHFDGFDITLGVNF